MASAADPFNVAALIPDFDDKLAAIQSASARTRAAMRSQLDVRYGPLPANRIDLFFPEGQVRDAPIHMFIHGGYWRGQVKEDYVLVADAVTAMGGIAAIIEYSLMPGARMAQQVGEVRAAAKWLAEQAPDFGGNGRALSASGHSAGAHLCSFLASRSPHESHLPATAVKSLLMLSGIYDLRPITTSYLQPELHLTPEEVAHWSPFEAVPSPDTHFEIVVGHDETQPFHIQAQDYAYVLERHGASHERVTMPGLDHMSLMHELGRPGGRMSDELRSAIERSRA